jgi:uncharacterized membrane protein
MSETIHQIHHKSRRIIRSFEAEALKRRPLIVKVADFLTSYFGTFTFLAVNVVAFTIWVLGNSGKIPGFPIFDPFPYSFMGSFISIEAIILTVIILISQNRENQRDILRNELGLQVQLISEKEITKILRLLKEIKAKDGNINDDTELDEMTTEIDASYIERKLETQLERPENIVQEVGDKIQEKMSPKK